MKELEDLGFSPAWVKKAAGALRSLCNAADSNGVARDALYAAIAPSMRPLGSRGGARTRAGRPARQWPISTGFTDSIGVVSGHELFGLEFVIFIEMMTRGLKSKKAAFEHLMHRREAITELAQAGSIDGVNTAADNRLIEQLMRDPAFQRRTAKRRPTWDSYTHALKRPPEAAIAARKARRDIVKERCGIDPRTGRSLQTVKHA